MSVCFVSCILPAARCRVPREVLLLLLRRRRKKWNHKELTEATFDYGIFGSLFISAFFSWAAVGQCNQVDEWGGVGQARVERSWVAPLCLLGGGAPSCTTQTHKKNPPRVRPKRIKAICVQSAQLSFHCCRHGPVLLQVLFLVLVLWFSSSSWSPYWLRN